jgi:flagellar motor protein MotB
MRNAVRRWHREEEEESAFVSMTDMTVSFLFVVMILLAFFATKLSDPDTVPRKDYELAIEERNHARTQVDQLTARVAELTRQVKLLEARVESLQLDNEKLKAENERLKPENERLRAEIAALKAEIESLRVRLQSPLEQYLSQAAIERSRLLKRLREQLRTEFPELMVEISAEGDALRFQGEGLFKTNESILHEKQMQIVAAIAEKLDDLLPCYTLGPRANWEESCNPGGAIIEAVQIEGHTDSDGSDLRNLELSTDRANATFAAMVEARPSLAEHKNFREQPVLSVAGYGRWRPVADNATVEGKRTNRRIDLRIIMYTPAGSQEIDQIRKRLRGSGEGLQ